MKKIEGKYATSYLDSLLYSLPDAKSGENALSVLQAGLAVRRVGRNLEDHSLPISVGIHGFPQLEQWRGDVARHLRDLSAANNALIADGIALLESSKQFDTDTTRVAVRQIQAKTETMNQLRRTVSSFRPGVVEQWTNERREDFPWQLLEHMPGAIFTPDYRTKGDVSKGLGLRYVEASGGSAFTSGGNIYNDRQLLIAVRIDMRDIRRIDGLRLLGLNSQVGKLSDFILPDTGGYNSFQSKDDYNRTDIPLFTDALPEERRIVVKALIDTEHPNIRDAVVNVDLTAVDSDTIDTYYNLLYTMYRAYKRLDRDMPSLIKEGGSGWADPLLNAITEINVAIDPFRETPVYDMLVGTWACLITEVQNDLSGLQMATTNAVTHRMSEDQVSAALAVSGQKAWDITQMWPIPRLVAAYKNRTTPNT